MAESASKVVKIDGKDYVFELTVAAHKRVKLLAEISLPDCVSDITGVKDQAEREKSLIGFYKLMRDFDKLPRIIWAMLLPQLEKNNVSEEKFDELFGGIVAYQCGEAITQALIDFFLQQKDQRGEMLRTSVELAKKAMKIDQKWAEQTTKEMEKRLAEMEKAMTGQKGADAAAQVIRETLTTSSTTLPESLASILNPSP